MPNMKYAALSALVLMITWGVRAVEVTQMDPSKTTYGERNHPCTKQKTVTQQR
jgi:hypothetical protein